MLAQNRRPWCSPFQVKVALSCPTLCDSMDYTVHGMLQARILEWIASPYSRGSSQPRDCTQVSRIAGGFFTNWAIREALSTPSNAPLKDLRWKSLAISWMVSDRLKHYVLEIKSLFSKVIYALFSLLTIWNHRQYEHFRGYMSSHWFFWGAKDLQALSLLFLWCISTVSLCAFHPLFFFPFVAIFWIEFLFSFLLFLIPTATAYSFVNNPLYNYC